MTTPHQADRYYRIMIAIAGLASLIYSLRTIPQIGTHFGIFLLLALFAGYLIQYPIILLQNEITLIPLVALFGGFFLGPTPAIWAITMGIFSGFTFRWMAREGRTWRYLFSQNAWIKIGYKVGIICIPLVVTFSIFGYSNKLTENQEQTLWPSSLWVSAVFMGLYGVLLIGSFIISLPRNPYSKRWSETITLIAIELLSILFVLLIVEIYPENNAEALALFVGIPVLMVYLLNRLNATQIINERRVLELSTLNHISSTIRSTLNLDELLSVIQEKVMQLFNIDNFYVALLDRETEELWYPFAMKFGQKQIWPRRDIKSIDGPSYSKWRGNSNNTSNQTKTRSRRVTSQRGNPYILVGSTVNFFRTHNWLSGSFYNQTRHFLHISRCRCTDNPFWADQRCH